jgi:hypothetical protein
MERVTLLSIAERCPLLKVGIVYARGTAFQGNANKKVMKKQRRIEEKRDRKCSCITKGGV